MNILKGLIFSILILCLLTACTSDKTYTAAGTVSAIKLETSGSVSSGTIFPNFILGGSAYAVSGIPSTENKPVILYACRQSLFEQIFNLSAGDTAIVYVGTKGETAEETQYRILAYKDLIKKETIIHTNTSKQE